MAKSRLSMRREVEAAEAAEENKPAKKKAAKKKATRKKAAPRARRAKELIPRRRLVWVVYSSTMREEGRYLYHERDKADEKLEQLMSKGKRRYFIQPIKEPLDSEGVPMDEEAAATPKVAAKKAAKKAPKKAVDKVVDEEKDE